MKILAQVSRFVVGILFIISGFVKLIDPVGTAIKLEEYFLIFAQKATILSFFNGLAHIATPLSVLFIIAEVVLGVCLILAYKMKISAWITLGMIVFFTFLTGYSAYTGDVTDCGCFGDAMPLKPLQSFIKDLVLLVLVVVIFLYREKYTAFLDDKNNMILIVCATIASFFFSWSNYQYLPAIDFRPYKIGANLDSLTHNGTPDVYVYEFEDTVTKEHTKSEKYLKGKYKYIGYEVQKGEDATIPDFIVIDNEGTDHNKEIMVGEKLLFCFYSMPSKEEFGKLNEVAKKALEAKKEVVYLTATNYEETKKMLEDNAYIHTSFYNLDATVIKAMIRSNPGILILKDGIVMKKWHINSIESVSFD